MQIVKTASLLFCVVLLCAIFSPVARADDWNEKTSVTFKVPVEIPGKALPAGTYIFKLADSQADRHIVQIWNANQTHLLATIFAVPEDRINARYKTVMHFDERPIHSPMALDDWFYPGKTIGNEFVYPNWG
ncbi:MAG: hypothetical protein WCE61_14560 [Candidatus Acidiferrum sp.]